MSPKKDKTFCQKGFPGLVVKNFLQNEFRIFARGSCICSNYFALNPGWQKHFALFPGLTASASILYTYQKFLCPITFKFFYLPLLNIMNSRVKIPPPLWFEVLIVILAIVPPRYQFILHIIPYLLFQNKHNYQTTAGCVQFCLCCPRLSPA